jgi:hypothetical protein
MTIAAHTVVVQSQQPLAARVDNELVLLNVDAGTYYGFSELGSEVWNRIAAPMNVGRLCVELAAEFDVGVETVTRDVMAFLAQLAEYRLIEILDERGA